MKKVKTIGCEEALKHLLAYLDQEAGAIKRREVERHIEICRTCFSRAEFEQSLKTRLREAGRGTMRSSFEKRIKILFDQFTTKQKRETP
ncbi:MAG: zf-HC2 domain-containing protein [Nitrospira sp.]|nr:zf-HC2 domain-containing protein [Nitrospira sp.]MDF0677506.1 zf-HC2 domain-containing protein [Nitrospira sp.]